MGLNSRPLDPQIGGPRYAALPERAGPMKAARKRLGVLPGLVRWAQVGPKPCTRRWGCAATGGRPRGLFCSGQLAGGRERPVSTVIVWNELEHHTFPVVQYTQIG